MPDALKLSWTRLISIIFLFLLHSSLFTLLLSGCTPSPEADSTVHLSLWHGFTAEETVVLRELVAEYERTQRAPDGRPVKVAVEYVSYNDMFVKLKTAALGRITPDMAFVDSIKVTDLAFGNALVPINELEGFKQRYGSIDVAREQFVNASFDSGLVNRLGETALYALPVQTTTVALFWNREIFRRRAADLRAAGLDPNRPPQTWEEMEAYGRVLTRPQDEVYAFGMSGSMWFTFPYFNMFGVNWVRYDESGRAFSDLDEKRTLGALGLLKRIATAEWEGGSWRRSALIPEAGFINGRYAMILTGPWQVEAFRNAGLDFDVALIPAPGPKDIAALGLEPVATGERRERLGPLAWSSSNVGGQSGVILRTATEQEAAYEFLEWFTSEDVQRRWGSSLGQIPVRLAAWENLDTTNYPFMPRFMEQLALSRRVPPVPLFALLEGDVFNPEVDLLLSGRQGEAAMLRNMERALERVILSRINEGLEE
jgi:ABC-type glycerol-3-phosphate transport system substrate-binding protein